MRIAFIANYERTICFYQVAKRLEAEGNKVFWISPSRYWSNWLRKAGICSSSILDLTRYAHVWKNRLATRKELEELASLEAISGIFINDLILMDRILRRRPKGHVSAYLATTNRIIRKYLADNSIQIVFAEQTFGIEILTSLVCRTLNIEMLAPASVRIPSGHLGFFRGHLQEELVQLCTVSESDRRWATSFLDEFRSKKPRPDYFHLNNRQPLPQLSWPGKLFRHFLRSFDDPNDETHFSPTWLMRQRIREVINAWKNLRNHDFDKKPFQNRCFYILVTLHRQPEASVDVLASKYSNQTEFIRVLARSLPVNYQIYVKEHSNGLGDRSPQELKQILKIPGVKLIHPYVDTFDLIKGAEAVVSLSGTVSFEAALLGKPAACVAPMFFGPLLVANGIDPYRNGLSGLFSAPKKLPSDESIINFLSFIKSASFPGKLNNPNFDKDSLSSDNLTLVSRGFSRVLKKMNSC